ncbi:TetR/AcrR family transcriptional regulator [Tsukamurella soli]
MGDFQRARSEDQREIRRRAIVETAATMLTEISVSELSLNALSRRVGLAKSNVLRYFESREAVLLELLVQLAADFYAQISEQLPVAVDDRESARARATQVGSILAEGLAAQPMLCELISAQASVLEHNVSAEAVAKYKRGGYQSLAGLMGVLRQVLPELSEDDAGEAVRTLIVLTGALWAYAHPPQAVQDAYKADPSLVFLPHGFVRSLGRSFSLVLEGLLACD